MLSFSFALRVGAQQSVPLVPAQGAWLGVFYGDGSMAETEKRIGRTPPIHLAYFSMEDDWSVAARRDLDAGRVPLICWEPDKVDFS